MPDRLHSISSLAPLGALSVVLVTACGGAASRYASPSYAPQPSSSYEAEQISVASAESYDDSTSSAPAPTPVLQSAQSVPAGPANAQQVAADDKGQLLQEKLVIEGWLSLEVADVVQAAAAIRNRVESAGGRVVTEQLSGGASAVTGQIQIKVPPAHTRDFLAWLEDIGDIDEKRIQGTDVSRTLFDQEIALGNLDATLARMRKLIEREGLTMQDILAIEREMQRLRGEIERIKGEKRYLEHRVAYATVDITLRRPADDVVVLGRAKAKLYPGARASMLYLFDPDGREQTRIGGGVVVHTIPRLTLELDVFEEEGGDNAVLATFGGAMYSDFLGRGRNRFLNPYLGLRVGYAYLGDSAFAFGAGGGVELFKHKYVLIDAGVNVYGFAGEEFTSAMVASGSLVVAF